MNVVVVFSVADGLNVKTNYKTFNQKVRLNNFERERGKKREEKRTTQISLMES